MKDAAGRPRLDAEGMASPANRIAGADESAANIRRLRPLRVLLAVRDRRFLRVTSFLLERRGYDVVLEGNANIAEAAARCRADVVLFDSDASRGSIARTIAALDALPAPPALLAISSDDGGGQLPGIATIPKWAPVDDLAHEIEAASLRRGAPAARASRSS